MPEPKADLQGEVVSAARGVVALVTGNRGAAQYFDLSMRGLVGSFIAFIAITGVNALLPLALGLEGARGSVFRSVATVALLFAFQVGFSALVLRQLKRADGLLPYLVADNWATFFLTLGTTILGLVGVGGEFLLIGVGILVIVVEINIARLIVKLPGLQVAMFLVAQLVGAFIGLIIVGLIFPIAPAGLPPIQ